MRFFTYKKDYLVCKFEQETHSFKVKKISNSIFNISYIEKIDF